MNCQGCRRGEVRSSNLEILGHLDRKVRGKNHHLSTLEDDGSIVGWARNRVQDMEK